MVMPIRPPGGRGRDASGPPERLAGLLDRLPQAEPDVVDQVGPEPQEPPQVGPVAPAEPPHLQRIPRRDEPFGEFRLAEQPPIARRLRRSEPVRRDHPRLHPHASGKMNHGAIEPPLPPRRKPSYLRLSLSFPGAREHALAPAIAQ